MELIEEYKITKVTDEKLVQFIDRWAEHNEPKVNQRGLIYSKSKDGWFTALDNTKGDCDVAVFRREENAIAWLIRTANIEFSISGG